MSEWEHLKSINIVEEGKKLLQPLFCVREETIARQCGKSIVGSHTAVLYVCCWFACCRVKGERHYNVLLFRGSASAEPRSVKLIRVYEQTLPTHRALPSGLVCVFISVCTDQCMKTSVIFLGWRYPAALCQTFGGKGSGGWALFDECTSTNI